MNNELNRFFDDCAKEVRNNRQYIRQYIEILDDDIAELKTKQPNINIAQVTKYIAQSAQPVVVTKNKNGRQITINEYEGKFDNALASLWFCFYRFLYISKLTPIYPYDVACNIVADSFFRLMKYVNLSEIGDGPQITALFHLVLHSSMVDQLKRLRSEPIIFLSAISNQEIDPVDLFGVEDNENEESRKKMLDLLEKCISHPVNLNNNAGSSINAISKRRTKAQVENLKNIKTSLQNTEKTEYKDLLRALKKLVQIYGRDNLEAIIDTGD